MIRQTKETIGERRRYDSKKDTPPFVDVGFRSPKACVRLFLILPFVSLIFFAFLPFDQALLIYLLALLLCAILYWFI